MADTSSKTSPLSRFIPTLAPTNFSESFKKEIYARFHRYILRPKYAKMWGFPYVDEEDSGKIKFNSNRFSKVMKSEMEKCRCGKHLYLNSKDWHVDENGCEFHPGKVNFCEKKRTDIYSCCKKKLPASGCVRREHHVSSLRACSGDEFVKTVQKESCFLPCLPNIFALDCEMVYTTKGIEVVKVTVLTVFCDVVYDTMVKPEHPVIDYNTEFSGIDESHLADVTIGLKQVQADLLELFDSETILVGHGLENDLLCLNLFHAKVIDTSILFPHSIGFPYRHSLKQLAMTYLNKLIHCDPVKGHDSREDARTCIELVARKIFVCKTRTSKKNPHYFQTIQSQMAANLIPNSIPNKFYGIPDYGNHPPVPMNWNTTYGVYPPLSALNQNQYPFVNAQHPLLSFPLVIADPKASNTSVPSKQDKKL